MPRKKKSKEKKPRKGIDIKIHIEDARHEIHDADVLERFFWITDGDHILFWQKSEDSEIIPQIFKDKEGIERIRDKHYPDYAYIFLPKAYIPKDS